MPAFLVLGRISVLVRLGSCSARSEVSAQVPPVRRGSSDRPWAALAMSVAAPALQVRAGGAGTG
jgi:hypothetical protein